MKKPFLSSSFKYKEQDPDYRGEPLEEDYTSGPVQERPCTDILCCILFLAFIAAMVYVAVIGFQKGNPEMLASPFDQDQNHCKFDPGFEEYPYIFISNQVANQSQISYVCVKQCPQSNSSLLQCHTNNIITDCAQLQVYASSTVVNICVPNVEVNFDFSHFDVSVLQEYFSDLRDAKYLVLGMFGIAFAFSIIYTFLMRCFAGCFIWTFILLFILLSLVVGVVALAMPEVQFLREILDYDSLPENLKDRDYQIACGSLCVGIALITTLVVCCMKREIKISIGIIKAAADFVRQCCSAIFIPVYISIMQILFIGCWVAVMLYVFSSTDNLDPINDTPFAQIHWNADIQNYTILYVFGLFWIFLFLQGVGAYWISSTVAIWYFQAGNPDTPILRSICRSFKNFGSIAFGSLLLAIVTIIRIVLQFLNNKAKHSTMAMNEGQAAMAKCAIKCAACVIACFQRVIRFLTQNAYIMMAISGKNFCGSAKEAFYLMLRCTAQFAISTGTTKIFINIGKGFILTLCCVIGYIMITSISPYREDIYSPVFLTIIFAIASYPIISAFMGLFEMAAGSLLMCYCIELDLSKGKSKCPPGLKNFLDEYVNSSSILNEIENRD